MMEMNALQASNLHLAIKKIQTQWANQTVCKHHDRAILSNTYIIRLRRKEGRNGQFCSVTQCFTAGGPIISRETLSNTAEPSIPSFFTLHSSFLFTDIEPCSHSDDLPIDLYNKVTHAKSIPD